MADNTTLNAGSGGDVMRTIAVTANSGAKTQVNIIDVGGGTDAETETPLALTPQGTQPAAGGLPTQALKDSGRTYVTFYIDAIAGVTTEALATFSQNKGGSVTTGTSFTVPTGMTLRIQSINATVKSSSTSAVYGRIRVRSAATVSATSPILLNLDIPDLTGTAAAGAGQAQDLSIPDGLEIAAGQQIGISQILSSTSSTISVCVVGFLY